MLDVKEIGDEYQWHLAMKDLANGDSRAAVAVLRDAEISFTPTMRNQLAAFMEVWPPKRPRKRPGKLTAAQHDELSTLLYHESDIIGHMRRDSQWFADRWGMEPQEVIEMAARWRAERRKVWARQLGISVHTLDALMKEERAKRRGKKSAT